MKRLIFSVLLIFVVSCGAVDSMTEGFEHKREVEADLEKALGQKPFVGFNWSNGSLTTVSVTFSGVPKNKSIGEIVKLSRGSIAAHFKQKPTEIVVAFAIDALPVNSNTQQKARASGD